VLLQPVLALMVEVGQSNESCALLLNNSGVCKSSSFIKFRFEDPIVIFCKAFIGEEERIRGESSTSLERPFDDTILFFGLFELVSS
jgi:hypothetical protein